VEQYAFTGEVGQVSQPLYDEDTAKLGGYWLLKIAERDDEAEDIRPLAILLPSLEEAEAIRERAVAGEDFAALVEEFSQHESSKEDNGNLGFIGRDDIMFSAFGEDIFEYEVGDITEPIWYDEVWTTGGYWLVKVEEEDDDRPIEGANRDILKSKLLDDWVASLRENAEVENYLDESKISWAVERALEELE
jgi:parvulin-like peptidyl-prolyl isomerase